MTPEYLDYLTQQVQNLGLAQRDHRVGLLLAGITPERNHRITAHLTDELQQIIQAATEQQAAVPFPLLPPELLGMGQFAIAYQAVDQTPITITTEELTRHTLITGASGSGKTNLLLHLLLHIGYRVRLWMLDLKDDLRWLAAQHPGMVVITPATRLNLLAVPSYLTVGQHISILVDTFADTLWGGEATRQVLTEALTQTYTNHNAPSLVDLRHTIDGLSKKGDTYHRRDAVNGASQRLQRLQGQYPGIATCHRGLTIEDLIPLSVYLPVTLLTELDEFLFTLLTTHLYVHHRSTGARNQLTHLVVMDEGLATWTSRNQGRITGTPPLTGPLGMSREFGIGYLITTNNLTTTDVVLKSNTSTKLLTPLQDANDYQEAKAAFGLTDEQLQYLRTGFGRGQVLVHIAHRTPTPVLAVHPPVNLDKTVSLADWQSALQRTELLTPPEPRPDLSLGQESPRIATPENTGAPQPPSPTKTVAHDAATKHESTKQTVRTQDQAPAIRPSTTAPSTEARIALSPNEEQLLRSTVERIAPATTHYQALELHPQLGTRAKTKLVALGLVTEHKIVVRSGRGGTALALSATPAGTTRSGVRRPRGTRGGDSVQHQYLIQELARQLPHALAEFNLDGKSVDLLTPNTPELRECLRRASDDPTAIDGFLKGVAESSRLAIEVEVSDPLTTAPKNVRRNHEAGITRTIVAVLPGVLDKTRAKLPSLLPASLRDRVLIVDVLGLLDTPKQKDRP